MCLFVVGTLLSVTLFIAKKAIIASASPLVFLFLSMFGAGVVLLILGSLLNKPPLINRRTLEYGFVAGGLFALPNAIAFLAVIHVGAGFLSLTFAFPTILTYVVALLIGMEKFGPKRAIGVVSGLFGGVLLTISKVSLDDAELFWIFLSLLSPVIIAFGNIYRTLRWPTGVSPLSLAAMMLVGGALLLVPFISFLGFFEFTQILNSSYLQILLVLQVLVFSVLYVLYFILQKLAGPVYLSQIGAVAAIVGAVFAVSLLGETPPPAIWISAIFIALAMAFFHWSQVK